MRPTRYLYQGRPVKKVCEELGLNYPNVIYTIKRTHDVDLTIKVFLREQEKEKEKESESKADKNV